MIDLERLKPDWDFAERHANAVKPGRDSIKFEGFDQQTAQSLKLICPCCMNVIKKQPQNLCVNVKELEYLGFGFPIFYMYIKYCIILLILSILSYNAISLQKAINYNYGECEQQTQQIVQEGQLNCSSFMIRFARTQKVVSKQQILLRCVGFAVHLIVLIFMRDQILKRISYFDERSCLISDFAIKIDGLPQKVNGIQEKLKKFFQNAFSPQNVQIKDIILFPYYQEFKYLLDQKKEILKQYKKILKNNQTQKQEAIQLQLKVLEQKIQQKFLEYIGLQKQDKLHASRAIILFQTEPLRTLILEKSKKLTFQNYQDYFGLTLEKSLQLSLAPQPKQIIWKDANYPAKSRYLRILIAWILSILVIAVATVGFYFILRAKSSYLQNSSNDNREVAIFLVYFLMVLVILFNKFIMGKVFHEFTLLQKHDMSQKVEISFAIKYLLGLFFTTALMTLIVEAATFGNYYTNPYGVVEEQTLFFFMNAFFIPFLWFVNPFQIFVLIKRKLYYGKNYLSQQQANHIMQDFNYSMGKRYAQIIKTIWFTFLYISLIPFGAILSLIGLSLYYWADKFNLLRKSSVLQNVSGKLTILVMKLMDFSLMLRAIGQIIFDHHLRDGVQACSIVFISIGFVYMLLPINKIILLFNQQDFYQNQKPYSEAVNTFKHTYNSQHPVYSRIDKEQYELHVKNLLCSLVQKQKLSQSELAKRLTVMSARNLLFDTQGWNQ